MDENEWERLDGIARDGWVRWSRYLLMLIGVGYILIGLGIAISFLLRDVPEVEGGAPTWIYPLSGGVGGCCTGVFGIFNFVAANGLSNGRKWAWYLSILLGAMYVPSCCLPFGALIVYGLLRDTTRARFQS